MYLIFQLVCLSPTLFFQGFIVFPIDPHDMFFIHYMYNRFCEVALLFTPYVLGEGRQQYKLPLGLHRQFQKSELVALARPIIKFLKMKKQLHSYIYTIRNLLIGLNSSDYNKVKF